MIEVKDEMSPMVTILANLNKEGYQTQFKATKDGICSMTTDQSYLPGDVEIKHFYRFEGESDPGDNAIVYAIETNSGEKGTLIDSYGANNDPLISEFISEVESIRK